jgi:hypothetical protein
MKYLGLIAVVTMLFLAGCSTAEKVDEYSSSTLAGISGLGAGALKRVNGLVIDDHMAVYEIGELVLDLSVPDGMKVSNAELYLDEFFIGNFKEKIFKLCLKRGVHTIRITLPGCEEYNSKIMLLGNPNHQVLNIELKREKVNK